VVVNDPERSKKGKFRICNFELATKLPEHLDQNTLSTDTCYIIYASAYNLGEFSREASSPIRMLSKKYYYPFKEDVFSLGLSLLQLALFSTCQGIKDLRSDEETLKRAVYLDCGVRGYSDAFKCLLLIMLRWKSAERPDFIQLEQIHRDLMRMEDNQCKVLLKSLTTNTMTRKSMIISP